MVPKVLVLLRQKYEAKITLALVAVLGLGLLVRVPIWRQVGSLSWDEGAHALAGLGLSRSVLSVDYMGHFFTHYWASTGSLFFYPWAYDLVVVPSYLLFGDTVFAARLPNFLASLLIIPTAYWLGKEAYGRGAAWLSAIIAALNPWLIVWSGQALVDVPIVLCITIATASLLRALKRSGWTWWLVAGLALGMAGQFKPPALVPIIPITIYAVAAIYANGKSLYWKNYSGLLLMWLVVSIIAGSYFLFGIISPHIWWLGDHAANNIAHWYPWTTIYAEPGDPTWKTVSGWTYYLKLLPQQFGLFPVVLLICGLVRALFIRRQPVDYLLWGTILFTYLIFVIVPNKDTRYTMLAFPALFAVSAQAAVEIYSWLKQHSSAKQIYTVVALSIFLIALTSTTAIKQAAKQVSLPSYPFESLAKDIVQNQGGLVVVVGESNSINVQSASWYVAAADKNLQAEVYWADRLAMATWAISYQPRQIDGFSQFARYNQSANQTSLYLYRRNSQ